MEWVAQYKPKPKGPAALSVAIMLAWRLNDNTMRCDPSIDQIVEDTEFSRQTVVSAIKTLVDHGMLEVKRRGRAASMYSFIGFEVQNLDCSDFKKSNSAAKKSKKAPNKVQNLDPNRKEQNTNRNGGSFYIFSQDSPREGQAQPTEKNKNSQRADKNSDFKALVSSDFTPGQESVQQLHALGLSDEQIDYYRGLFIDFAQANERRYGDHQAAFRYFCKSGVSKQRAEETRDAKNSRVHAERKETKFERTERERNEAIAAILAEGDEADDALVMGGNGRDLRGTLDGAVWRVTDHDE